MLENQPQVQTELEPANHEEIMTFYKKNYIAVNNHFIKNDLKINPFIKLGVLKEKAKKILIVEDDEIIRFLISEALQIEKYEVIEAENGLSGFEMAKQYKPDLIVSDIMMPVMDGYELLQKLKDTSETAEIPFIFLSAVNSPASIRLSKELGANNYLVKPFNKKELIPVIQELIKQKLKL
jgi:CheY-like chemotaxis protein